MISSTKPISSSLTAIGGVRRSVPAKLRFSPLPIIRYFEKPNPFPLHVLSSQNLSNFSVAAAQRRDVFRVGAYEADRSQPIDIGMEIPDEQSGQKVKIGIYFATWWALNVVFNIYNKKVLNAFPYPWLTSTLSHACGSLMMLVSWVTRVADAPKTDLDFWKTLFPVAVAHTIGHVAATVSMSKVAVSFTHIIKSGEPAFSVLVSRLFLGDTFPLPVYLSLLPIIGGCALAAVTELNFNMIGFMGAMISNLAFVFRNIFSKKGMKGKSVSGMNYYACLSMMSLLIVTPFAIAVEGPQVWAAGWQNAVSEIGPNFVWWVVAQSVFYHLYNQVSYMSLDQISPLTFSVGNTMKRISVIVASIIIFHTPIRPVNALGAAIAILGTFIYSQIEQRFMALKPKSLYLPTSSYQHPVKVGTRCYLKDVFKTLDGLNPPLTKREREWFISHPQFKHLFHMPKDHNHKVQGMWMLVLRTAEILKTKEVWFVVNGVPVRYGLREHALISGLNCRNYPLGYKERGNMNFITRHFGTGTVRQEDVKAKLQEMGCGNDRLKMVVLFFLSSIVCAQTKTGDGAPDVLEVFKRAVEDLDYCRTFPWGRFSYDFMVKEIMHTVEHFQAKGGVKAGTQWPIPGFCIPLELLAFEAIPQLGKRFRESVPEADSMCPRMCKSKFKKGDMKGFPIEAINEELGTTKDIDSLVLISLREEKMLLDQILEEEEDRDEDDLVVDSWINRLAGGYTIFFEDLFDQDVDARAEKDKEMERLEAPPVQTPPTELAEILKTIKEIQEKVNDFDARLAVVEASMEDDRDEDEDES